jgi:hypothetical protein
LVRIVYTKQFFQEIRPLKHIALRRVDGHQSVKKVFLVFSGLQVLLQKMKAAPKRKVGAVPFGRCSIWGLFHLGAVPFGRCFIWAMFHLGGPAAFLRVII